MNKSRIYSLDVFRLLLAFVVAMGHYRIYLPPTSAVAVDYFFILSGFYLARKFYAETHGKGDAGYSAWDYTIAHARSCYPYFLFALAIAFLYELSRVLVYLMLEPSWHSLWEMGALFYDQIPDLLLLHSSHYWEIGLLPPSWQISATIICGYFVYELLRQNERLTRRVLLPVSLLMLRSVMYAGADYFDNYGLIYMPLLRGFAAMGLGVLTWYFVGTKYYTAMQIHKTAVNICSLLAIAGLVLYSDRARIFLVLLPFLIVVCQDPTAWINRALNHRCFRFCGKLSLAVYLSHPIMLRVVENVLEPRLDLSQNQLAIVYAALVAAFGVFTMVAVEWLMKLCRKKT